jgi:hypothetical protein
MTTKPPAGIVELSTESLEKTAYAIASEIPTREPNDAHRLGYCLWGWLTERRGSLLQAIHAAGARTNLSEKEILALISKRLEEKGIKIP